MPEQLQINWNEVALHRENNRFSEQILCDQATRLSNNCRKLYEALLRGERLTGAIIIAKYGMIEFRRRIKDLKEAGLDIKENLLPGGCKEWYLGNLNNH